MASGIMYAVVFKPVYFFEDSFQAQWPNRTHGGTVPEHVLGRLSSFDVGVHLCQSHLSSAAFFSARFQKLAVAWATLHMP